MSDDVNDEQVTEADVLEAFERGFLGDDAPLTPPDADEQTTVDAVTTTEETTEDEDEGGTQADTETPRQETTSPTVDPKLAERLAVLEAAMENRLSTVFGKMGGIERTVKELKGLTAKTPALRGQWTVDDFKELAEEFPEITDKLITGFNAGVGRFTPAEAEKTEAPDMSGFVTTTELAAWKESERAALREENTRITAANILGYLSPGWAETVGEEGDKTPYRVWLAKQPEEYQEKINTSWNPVDIRDSIEQFTQVSAAKGKKKVQKQDESQRAIFRAAVPAKQSGRTENTAPEMTEEDAMLAAFYD